MPKPLDLGRLQKFEPSVPASEQKETSIQTVPVGDRADRWPSREPMMDGQISIKGPLTTIKRFQALCKEDRRTYADMLKILMDKFEQSS